MVIFFLILYLRAISSPEKFLSFIGMDQDPASYFQNGLDMTFLLLNFCHCLNLFFVTRVCTTFLTSTVSKAIQ